MSNIQKIYVAGYCGAHDLAEAKKHALLKHHGYSVNVSVE